VIVIGVSFAGLNADSVNFNYYIGSIDIPLSLLLALAFAVGGFLGVIASLSVIMRAKGEERRARRALKKSESAQPVHPA
jgi:putative membrane protein